MTSHGTLGLNRRQTDWALFLMGLVLQKAATPYRTTPAHHVPPSDDDPEGYPAKISLIGAIPRAGCLWRASVPGPLTQLPAPFPACLASG
jgi:hypothetical protein